MEVHCILQWHWDWAHNQLQGKSAEVLGLLAVASIGIPTATEPLVDEQTSPVYIGKVARPASLELRMFAMRFLILRLCLLVCSSGSAFTAAADHRHTVHVARGGSVSAAGNYTDESIFQSNELIFGDPSQVGRPRRPTRYLRTTTILTALRTEVHSRSSFSRPILAVVTVPRQNPWQSSF